MSYGFTADIFSVINESLVGYKTKADNLRFLVDAQLPVLVSTFLKSKGYDAIHTSELPLGNATGDNVIRNIVIAENRILITKDDDFLQSYLLYNMPEKLLLVKTGNIRNSELLKIFQNGFEIICRLFTKHSLIEITKEQIITHE